MTFKNRKIRASVVYQLNPKTEWLALVLLHMYVYVHNEAGIFFFCRLIHSFMLTVRYSYITTV